MLLDAALERFAQASPVSVLLRAALEFALPAADVDALFLRTARSQYTRALLFSSVIEVMSLVVLRLRPSVHNAYQACRDKLGVSAKALYDKLAHTEPEVCSALVRYQADKVAPLLRQFGGGRPPLLPGYRVRLLDGNHLAKTDRRLKELRGLRPGPLPGQALVVYDADQGLITDVCCCEDGHAQERALVGRILSLIRRRDVWVADRNFCTTDFLFGIAARGGSFVIRQHRQNLRGRLRGRLRSRGRTDTGRVFEQDLDLFGPEGRKRRVRRITVRLDQPTRDGETELHLISNLPARAEAKTIARLYRERWTIETAFAQIEDLLQAEIATLAYPKAALLAFSVGLMAYNLLQVITGALRGVHGAAVVEEAVSVWALAEEATMTYRGMMIAVGEEAWQGFGAMGAEELAVVLKELASRIRLEKYRKHRRGPKKPVLKRGPRKPHVATARLLKEREPVRK